MTYRGMCQLNSKTTINVIRVLGEEFNRLIAHSVNLSTFFI
jgi:NADH:ubiquinone oxidoreductase subunit D